MLEDTRIFRLVDLCVTLAYLVKASGFTASFNGHFLAPFQKIAGEETRDPRFESLI